MGKTSVDFRFPQWWPNETTRLGWTHCHCGGKLSLPSLLWFFYPPGHSPLLRVLGAGALDEPEGWDGEGSGRGFRMENTCTPVADSCQWMNVSFTSAFSFSSFTLIKRLFSSSSLSTIRVVSSAYLRLLIFLLVILILAWEYLAWHFA